MIQISQASTGRSQNGEELQSSNHISCYSVVIVNSETKDSIMFHVWEGGHNGFSMEQQEAFEEFLKPLGQKLAIITEGSRSSSSCSIQHMLTCAGIDILEVKQITTGNARWNALFDPKTRCLTIDDEKGVMHYRGIVFPDYVAIPPQEQNLSDRERRILRLQKFANKRNGDLPKTTLHQLHMLLRRDFGADRDIGSTLLSDFLDKRAKAAGFSDYNDYIDADLENYTRVDTDGGEMVLRKIFDPQAASRKRFRKAGHDFRKVHVTPKAVVELLQDYPVIIDKFTNMLAAEKKKKPAAHTIVSSI